MNAYHIREARPQDLEGVYTVFNLTNTLHCQVHPEIFQEAVDPNDVKDYILAGIQEENAAVFLAEENARIIGVILAVMCQTPDISILVKRSYVSVENLVVVEAYRQQGIGQALMEQIHLWAQARGIKEIELTVWNFNQGAAAFYEKLGYRMLHHRMRKVLP